MPCEDEVKSSVGEKGGTDHGEENPEGFEFGGTFHPAQVKVGVGDSPKDLQKKEYSDAT